MEESAVESEHDDSNPAVQSESEISIHSESEISIHSESEISIHSESEISIHSIPMSYHPSGAKDDDMVDGYGNRMHNQGRSIEYDDILVAREAFSENDAYSISDASEVSVEDFAFDDHLPLKDEEDTEEEIDLDDDLKLPLSETPDIMELTDEMLDAYLQMEEEILQEVEAEMEEEEKTSKAAAALEFWTMSPREENMPRMEDIKKMRAVLRRENGDLELKGEEEDTSEKEDMSFQEMCSAYSEKIASIEEHHGRLDSVGSDFLSEEAEEALECMVSGGMIEDEYDGDLDDDDAFCQEEAIHDITLTGDALFADETQEFNDDFAGWMIGSMEDVAEYPESLEIDCLNSHGSTEGRQSVDDGDYHDIEEEREDGNETGDDLPDICPDDSIFLFEGDGSLFSFEGDSVLSAAPSPAVPKDSEQIASFFPSIENESPLTDSLLTSLRSFSVPTEPRHFFKGSKLFPPLESTDDVPSRDREEEITFSAHSFRRRSEVQGMNATWPVMQHENTEEKEKDNLLEITDISLTHMYESLDFVTELVHQISPDESRRSVDQNSRYNSFSEAVDKTELKASHSMSDSFDIVANIVRKMVPTYEDETEEERRTVIKHTNTSEEVCDYSQSELPVDTDFQEVESPNAAVLSNSLPLSLSMWQHGCMHDCTGSFNYTWPSSTATCENSECKELASIQAAVKHTLSNALKEEEDPSMMEGEQPVKKSKKSKRNKRKAASPISSTSSIHQDGTEGSCTGSCDTGFHSLLSTDDEKSSQDPMKLSEVESPCTMVKDDNSSPTKSGYMSYVSQIAEACSEGNLDEYLSTTKHKQCYLWSVPPPAADTPEEVVIKEEIGELENNVSDLLLTTEELETKWELDSQATDNTDKLIAATNSLVEELTSGKGLEAGDLEEDQVGSWKDVIVLWMDKNGQVRDAQTQGCTPITVPSDYMQLHGQQRTPIIEVSYI